VPIVGRTIMASVAANTRPRSAIAMPDGIGAGIGIAIGRVGRGIAIAAVGAGIGIAIGRVGGGIAIATVGAGIGIAIGRVSGRIAVATVGASTRPVNTGVGVGVGVGVEMRPIAGRRIGSGTTIASKRSI